MEPYKIVAILDRSAGNDSVGEAWHETKVFEPTDTLENVLTWAAKRTYNKKIASEFIGNLKLTIAQE